jgi:hypothetical protein
MRTCPKWTVTRYAGANHNTIPQQYRHALVKRFPYPMTAQIPRAGTMGTYLPSIIE